MKPAEMRYATEYCKKYPEQSLTAFAKNSLSCTTEMVSDFLLVQYKIEDDIRIIYSMFFDCDKWNKSVSDIRLVKHWFSGFTNYYVCSLPRIPSIRKFITRLS